jgi:ubiquinone biosynthesis protein
LANVIQLPKEWVIFERASVLMLGLCTAVDPNMNPIRTVAPYLQQFVLGKDADWKGQISTAIREMAMSAVAIPDRANRFFERANKGDVQIHVAGLRDSALLLYSAAHQIVFVFLAIALGTLGFVLDARGQDALAVAAWTTGALSLLAVAVSMVRARSLRRKLREPVRPTR